MNLPETPQVGKKPFWILEISRYEKSRWSGDFRKYSLKRVANFVVITTLIYGITALITQDYRLGMLSAVIAMILYVIAYYAGRRQDDSKKFAKDRKTIIDNDPEKVSYSHHRDANILDLVVMFSTLAAIYQFI